MVTEKAGEIRELLEERGKNWRGGLNGGDMELLLKKMTSRVSDVIQFYQRGSKLPNWPREWQKLGTESKPSAKQRKVKDRRRNERSL